MAMSCNSSSSLTFFAIGDFGNPTKEVIAVAEAMNSYALEYGSPSFILGLGDNFYPTGVSSELDPKFKVAWSDVFLAHQALQVPWYVILGNHDYMGVPEAQVKFTTSTKNVGGFWRMPSPYYTVSWNDNHPEIPHNFIDLFAMDTNGCQGHVQRSHPSSIEHLQEQKIWLRERLEHSSAHWKVVIGHHPMYTKGRGHQLACVRLRDEMYTCNRYNRITKRYERAQCQGFGMENVVANGGADLYISGHEHVFQHTNHRDVQHVVCGNSGADIRENEGFYGGKLSVAHVDWHDQTNTYGFLAVTLTVDMMTIKMINASGEPFEILNRPHKPL